MKNRVALVTGAARGIGKAIALELAKSGAHVIINDYLLEKEAQEVVEEIRTFGNRSEFYQANISSQKEVLKMMEKIQQDFGCLDILVNNAGISPKHQGIKKPIYEMDPQEWEMAINVNLNGTFYCTRYAAPLMIAKRYGRIVNLSSMAARIYSPIPGVHYCSSKAGILGLTRVSAAELAPFNIIVNAIAPGRIESEMMDAFGKDRNQELLKTIPIGRFGTPQDVAKVVCFLVSEENNYVVGAVIDINGGRAML